MKLTTSERRTLTVTGAGAVLLLVWFLGVRPLLARAGTAAAEAGTLNDLAEAQSLLARAAAIESRHSQLSAAVTQAEERFFSGADPDQAAITLLRAVEQAAAAAGLNLRHKELRQAETGSSGPPLVRLELDGDGGSAAVTDFLIRLDRAPIAVDMERLSLEVEKDRTLRIRATICTILPRAGEGDRS